MHLFFQAIGQQFHPRQGRDQLTQRQQRLLRQTIRRLHLDETKIVGDLPAQPLHPLLLAALANHRLGVTVFCFPQPVPEVRLLSLGFLADLLQLDNLGLSGLDLGRQGGQPAVDHRLPGCSTTHLISQGFLFLVESDQPLVFGFDLGQQGRVRIAKLGQGRSPVLPCPLGQSGGGASI